MTRAGMGRAGRAWLASALVLALGLAAVDPLDAARISDVRGTKHNLSAAPDSSTYTYIDPVSGQPVTGTVPARSVRASTETQVCVFCHTPHQSTPGVSPLWNRQVTTQTYTPYTSETLDARVIQSQLQQPNGTSKLCLSCHDGSLAIGNVNVLNGSGSATVQGGVSIAMQGTGPGDAMPGGASGETSGFTRRLGTDLRNDHPISIDFTDQLAVRDGELRRLSGAQRYPAGDGSVIGVRGPGFKPKLPLEPTGTSGLGQVQCGTCHDPHARETNAALGNQKFLRQSRFQNVDPGATLAANYSPDQDIICIGCHEKNITPGVWAFSAHANPLVADESYKPVDAELREFPAGIRVWQASCLNCHDTHTVQGARRLLREGTDSVTRPKQGGTSAIEETCYQCHSTAAESVLNIATQVPNVKTDFLSARRMPITTLDQGAEAETHEISASFADVGFIDCSRLTDAGCGADFLESRTRLAARHAECTDCHNPHRVVRFQSGIRGALAGVPEKSGTHRHEDAAGFVHTNVISGVLRGTYGVEPLYPDSSFHSMPSSFLVKRGDPGANTDTSVAAPYATREYQICLKCHSNYAYNDDNVYPNSFNRPQFGGTGGGTPANSNGHTNFTSYTNQAKEFQAPVTHQGASGGRSLGFDGGAGASPATAATNNNNHRSWHPVMAPTGRLNRAGAFLAPWNNAGAGAQAGRLGVQTMYCSDCHGSNTNAATVMPVGNTATSEDGNPWGPHGSANNFLLKGQWDTASGEGNANTLCFKCHSQAAYSGGGGTGFQTDKGDGHTVHSDRIDTPLRCNFCHVAVPHGWKNRNLLVNLLDVGPEAGLARGTAVAFTNNVGYTNGPYYRRAFLRVISFPTGQWTESNCNGGSKDTMKTQCEAPN